MTREQISALSFHSLGKALSKGEVTEKEIRKYYTELRDIAQKRVKRIEQQREKLTEEFGVVETEHFRKLKDIKTTGDLMKEFSNLLKFTRKKTSSISGMRERKKMQIRYWQENEFPFVNESNYGDWIRFLQWFHDSKWSQVYDSNDNVIEQVFESSQNASPEEWERLVMEFSANYGDTENNKRERR